jgi:hypothetical protein
MRRYAVVFLLVGLSSSCGGSGGDSSKLEKQLKFGVGRAYEPVASVSCSKTGRELPTGEPLNDCTIHFASGKYVRWCAVLARGVAAWDRKPCGKSPLGRIGQ